MSTELNIRNNLFPTIARTSPILFFISLLLKSIIYPSITSYYLLISFVIIVFSNFILKYVIIKPIYKILGISSIPLFGIGNRPKGASSCDFTLDGKINTSFGMPSGHSQIAWTIATYIICKIIIKIKMQMQRRNILINILYILYVLLILYSALYISYSRVYIEGCHTIQQVIIGGIIGIISGFLIYYFEDKITKLFSYFSQFS